MFLQGSARRAHPGSILRTSGLNIHGEQTSLLECSRGLFLREVRGLLCILSTPAPIIAFATHGYEVVLERGFPTTPTKEMREAP